MPSTVPVLVCEGTLGEDAYQVYAYRFMFDLYVTAPDGSWSDYSGFKSVVLRLDTLSCIVRVLA